MPDPSWSRVTLCNKRIITDNWPNWQGQVIILTIETMQICVTSSIAQELLCSRGHVCIHLNIYFACSALSLAVYNAIKSFLMLSCTLTVPTGCDRHHRTRLLSLTIQEIHNPLIVNNDFKSTQPAYCHWRYTTSTDNQFREYTTSLLSIAIPTIPKQLIVIDNIRNLQMWYCS